MPEASSPGRSRSPHWDFDTPYDRLAPLPRAVWLPTLVSTVGHREARLDHAQQWMSALLRGLLPSEDAHFGDALACARLRQIVEQLALPPLCQGVPVLAEQVLRTLFWHFSYLSDLQPRHTRAEALDLMAASFDEAWRVSRAGLEAELALVRDLAQGESFTWDMLQGRWRPREWAAARRAAERLADLPALVALMQRIGRRHFTPAPRPEPVVIDQATEIQAPVRWEAAPWPGAPGEITGIRWGADLARMLPLESALRRHPAARRLWHARWAEGRLLIHDTLATWPRAVPDPMAPPRPAPPSQPQPAQGRGPIVLCLDTSGSMRGAPEQIAKAVALAALRTARQQQRACVLLAFGGSGELQQRSLSDEGGLDALLDLMGQSFDGGTDVQTPIERAIEWAHTDGWQGADLLIISDGEFGCVPATLQSLDEAREQLGLKVYGVLVGDRETLGLLEVCDEIEWVRDWRRHADPDDPQHSRPETRAAQPVHSKSLTALYFPNALSARAARHTTGSR